MPRIYYTYIVTNKNNTVLYTGVTNNLSRRIEEHRIKQNPKSFTARYNINKLVWYENYSSIVKAITREKQIKAGSRKKKLQLIEEMNPEWKDLMDSMLKS
jgi:putative endonuclease